MCKASGNIYLFLHRCTFTTLKTYSSCGVTSARGDKKQAQSTQHLHKLRCGPKIREMKGSWRKRMKTSAILHVLDVVFIWTPLLKDGNFNISSNYSSRSKRVWERMKSPTSYYENTYSRGNKKVLSTLSSWYVAQKTQETFHLPPSWGFTGVLSTDPSFQTAITELVLMSEELQQRPSRFINSKHYALCTAPY